MLLKDGYWCCCCCAGGNAGKLDDAQKAWDNGAAIVCFADAAVCADIEAICFAPVLTRLKHGDRVLPQWQHTFFMCLWHKCLCYRATSR
jgi:hypothetical protein